MPSEGLANAFRSHVTTAATALLFIASRGNFNSAEVTQPYAETPANQTHQNYWAVPENFPTFGTESEPPNIETARPTEASTIRELSPLGKKLLSLRRKAIAAGMPTLTSDEIMERYRELRDS